MGVCSEIAATGGVRIPPSQWEQAACLLCGSQQRSTLVRSSECCAARADRRPEVARCLQCGFCYTSPRPTAAASQHFYPPEYAPHQVRRMVKPRRRRLFARRVPGPNGVPWHGEGRLLDFGCGGGAFLQRMEHRGWNVLGVDASQPVVERIRAELGIPALAGDLAAPELARASFDVVTMWQALEHVHSPLEVLRKAHRLLVPGGRLIVSVPNIDSLGFRLFGSAWFGLDVPRHLSHFSVATLREILVRPGFRVDDEWMTCHSSWFQKSARLSFRRGRGGAWLRLLRSHAVCRWVARYALVSRQADCITVAAIRPAKAIAFRSTETGQCSTRSPRP